MKYLVTGGAGFIGSHVVDRLLKEGHSVIVLDNFSSGKEENLAEHDNLLVYKKSVCDNLNELFEKHKFDAVFHLAAIPEVQLSIDKPKETHEVNVNGTLNLLEACRKHCVNRFIFSSSTAVYGEQESIPHVETMKPNPLCPYALHKLIGEYYCKLYSSLFEMETISLRYFNVFGARQSPEGAYAGVIPKFFDMLKNDKTPVIFGDGEQTRDFIYVSDVVEANMLSLKTENKECFGNYFNIGSGSSISVNETTKIILKLTGKELKPENGPARIEIRHSLADVSKAKEFLKWESKVEFEEGLKRTYGL